MINKLLSAALTRWFHYSISKVEHTRRKRSDWNEPFWMNDWWEMCHHSIRDSPFILCMKCWFIDFASLFIKNSEENLQRRRESADRKQFLISVTIVCQQVSSLIFRLQDKHTQHINSDGFFGHECVSVCLCKNGIGNNSTARVIKWLGAVWEWCGRSAVCTTSPQHIHLSVLRTETHIK